MKKLTTGLVALGCGLVLLVGTSGSLALWNDSANVDAGNVTSGVLSIDASDGTWSQTLGHWVPGDSETYSADLSIVAQGDNLASHVTIDPDSITGDPELRDALQITLQFGATTGGSLVPVAGQTNVFEVIPDDPGATTPVTAPVTVTVTFPVDSVTDLEGQGQTVQLAGMRFALQQVAS